MEHRTPVEPFGMNAAKIMLIRHTERPSPDKSIIGVGLDGRKNKEDLTVRGWQRAGALARYFAPSDNHFSHPEIERPKSLFACRADQAAPSLRPQHSLLPISELIRVQINTNLAEGEEARLVEQVLTAPGAVLIAWKHRNMHVIANMILQDNSTAPQYWPYGRYDVTWIFSKKGERWTFTQVPQLLLSGDRPDVIV